MGAYKAGFFNEGVLGINNNGIEIYMMKINCLDEKVTPQEEQTGKGESVLVIPEGQCKK